MERRPIASNNRAVVKAAYIIEANEEAGPCFEGAGNIQKSDQCNPKQLICRYWNQK